jgi:hypothetical protein
LWGRRTRRKGKGGRVQQQGIVVVTIRRIQRTMGATQGEEEEEMDVFARYGASRPTDVPLRDDLLPSSSESTNTVPLSSIVIYVDPMDGTREFVEGRLGNVQCLIGITVDVVSWSY